MCRFLCICFCILNFSVLGDNLRLESSRLVSVSGDMAYVEMKLSWSNSWKNVYNHDAVYLFGKYQEEDTDRWYHLYFDTEAGANTVDAGYRLDVVNGGRGMFVYRDTEGMGTATVTLRFKWKLSANPESPLDVSSLTDDRIQFSMHVLEMVYVPTAPFYAGDSVSDHCFSAFSFGILPAAYDLIGLNSSYTYSGNGGEAAATYAAKAADRYDQAIWDASNRHNWCGTVMPAWWRVDFKSEKKIRYFGVSGLYLQDYPPAPASDWYLEGSNDATNWTILWQGGPEYWGQSAISYPVQQAIRVTTPGSYRYYQIRVTDNQRTALWNNIYIANVAMTETDLETLDKKEPLLLDKIVGHLPDHYPDGVNGFYAMKYELTQEQYVAFLNQLNREGQYTRTIGGILDRLEPGDYIFGDLKTAPDHRNGIVLQERHLNHNAPYVFACNLNPADMPNGLVDGQTLACNYLSPADMLAYADWSGLRPLSELEYEKMCRGYFPEKPVQRALAWGTVESVFATGIDKDGGEQEAPLGTTANVNAGEKIDGPVRSGMFVRQGDRLVSGNSFVGLSDLSGNLSEIYCNAEPYGRQLVYAVQGNGTLQENGNHTVERIEWPMETEAYGVRGGDYNSPVSELAVSDRSHSAAYFQEMTERRPNVGVRLGFSVEPERLTSVLTLENGRYSGNVIVYDTLCRALKYKIQGENLTNGSEVFQYLWFWSADDGNTWQRIEDRHTCDLELNEGDELLEASQVHHILIKRMAYWPAGINESGIVGLVFAYGYQVTRLRDTLYPCMKTPGLEVTTPLPAIYEWTCLDNGKLLKVQSEPSTTGHYEVATDDFRLGDEQPSGEYAVEVRIRVADKCVYRQKMEVLAVPGTLNPFPLGAETFAYDNSGNYTVTHAWGGRDFWSWKIYSELWANKITPETGIISGKVDTMCHITVGLVCEDCPDVEWRNDMKESRMFNYTGGVQAINLLLGNFAMECWGARGSQSRANNGLTGTPGYGGYAYGELEMPAEMKFYLYIGGAAGTPSRSGGGSGGWNGGATGGSDSDDDPGGGGGGASDIRLMNTAWNSVASLCSRIIVAGGGGGCGWGATGGGGGGLVGLNGSQAGGGQNYGASFGGGGGGGYGGNGYYGGGGGGGGYYGGYGAPRQGGSAGGGSGFVSGMVGCNAVDVNGIHTNQPNHYSGWIFKNATMLSGQCNGHGMIRITVK